MKGMLMANLKTVLSIVIAGPNSAGDESDDEE